MQSNSVVAHLYIYTQRLGTSPRVMLENLEIIANDLEFAGIRGIEGFLEWFEDPAQGARIVDQFNAKQIEVKGLYSGGCLHNACEELATIERMVTRAEYAAAAGCDVINMNPDPINWNGNSPKSETQLAAQARALETIGTELKRRRIELTVHHHNSEMRDGAREFYHVLHNTSPGLVGICLDIDWIVMGGQDPLQLLRDTGNRLKRVHLRTNRKGVWSESLRGGDIDYRSVAAVLRELNYQGPYVIELADSEITRTTTSLRDNLRSSREFVREVLGV